MTKKEIHEIANTIDTNIGKEIDEDYICCDVYDFTIGFECGAKIIKEKMIDKFCKLLEDCVCCNRVEFHEDYIEVLRKKLDE